MRLSLVRHREGRRGRGRRGRIAASVPTGMQRDQAVAAAETVALVLGEDSPLPESADDVEELARRLRGHISQLGFSAPPGATLRGAQQLASADVPDSYMPSRVHIVKLAEATQDLVAIVQAHGIAPAQPIRAFRGWKPRINVLRGSVFAVAFACLILAASVPRA